MIATLAFAIIVLVLMPLRSIVRLRKGTTEFRAHVYVVERFLLIAALLVVMRINHLPIAAIGIRHTTPAKLVLASLACVAVMLGVDALAIWWGRRTMVLSKAATLTSNSDLQNGLRHYLPSRPLSFDVFVFCFAAAAWEELCFRGAALHLLSSVSGIVVAICLSSCLFALQHLQGGGGQVLYSGCFGVFFCLMYLAMGNILPVIIAHSVGNLYVLSRVRQEPAIAQDTQGWF